MKALKILLIVIGILVAVFVIFALTSPTSLQVERSTVINKSPEVVFGQISDFKNWTNWSPWEKADPNMTLTYSEGSGDGSSVEWVSESQGSGKQTIVEYEEFTSMKMKMNFADWEGDNFAIWKFEEVEGGTKVTWGMDGAEAPFFFRPLLVMMSGSIEQMYDDGLSALKETCEGLPDAPQTFKGYKIDEVDVPMQEYLGMKDTVNWADMQQYFDDNFAKSMKATQEANIEVTGPLSGFYWMWDTENSRAYMATAVPVPAGTQLDGFESIEVEGKALKMTLEGPYSGSYNAHTAMGEYIQEKGFTHIAPVFEEYVVGPANSPDSTEWVTNIYYMIKG